jgi:hypothetical protein
MTMRCVVLAASARARRRRPGLGEPAPSAMRSTPLPPPNEEPRAEAFSILERGEDFDRDGSG